MANEVKLKLAIEGGQVVVQSVNGVSQSLDGLDKSAKSASSGAESLRTVLAGIVTIGTAVEVIRMADSVTTLRTSLNLASNSAAEAAVAYDRLFVIAQQGRVSFTALGDTYATIARSGKELGVSQDRLLTVTQAIANAMTIGGGSAQSMQAALVQLGQGLSSGTLRGEELNSILEQTPRLAKALADGMGVPIGQLRSLGEQGKLTAETVISALEKSGPQLAKEMSSSTVTVGQAFTMLTNSATKFVGEADAASGATGNLASALQGVAGVVDSVGNAINNHKEAFSAIANGLAGAAVVAGVAAMAGSIGTVTVAVKALGVAMLANPAILALTLIAAAGAGIASMASDWKKSAEGMRAQMDGINADISLAEERTRSGTEAVRARAAVEIQTLKDKRDALRQTMAVQDQSSAANASYNAKEMKGLQEKVAAEQAAYAGSKPLDEVRKMAKLRNDILIDANDQAVNIAKAFSKAIANASSPEVAFALEKERSARLITNAQETTAALKTFDDQKAAPAKEAAKLRLDALIAGYEQEQLVSTAGEQRKLEALAAAHALGIESDRSYLAAKQSLEENANIDQQAVVELELEAVRKSGLALKDRIAQETKYTAELQKLREQAASIVQKADQDMAAADMKVYRQAIDQNAQVIESQQAKAASLQDQVKAQRIANAEIGLSAREVNALRSATMELTAAEKERLATVLENASPELAKAYRDQATALRQLIVENTRGFEKSAAVEQSKAMWSSIGEAAHTTFNNILQGGQDMGTKLRDSLKASVYDWLYQMTAKRWLFNIAVATSGEGVANAAFPGMSGGGGSGSGSGVIGQAAGMANLYKQGASAMGWLTDFSGSVTGLVDSAGAAMMNSGSSMLGDMGASLVSNSSAIGSAAESIGSGLSYLSAAIAASKGKWGEAIGAGIGTYFFGPIGGAIGGAIGSAVDRAFGGGSEYSVARGIRVQGGGGSVSTKSYDQWRNDGSSGFFGIGGASASTGINYSAADDKLSKQVSGAYAAIQIETAAYAVALGLSTDAIKNFTSDMTVNLTADAAANTAAITKMFADLANNMAGQILDPIYIRDGETASVTLKRLGDSLLTVNNVMGMVGGTLFQLSQAGASAASGLIDAMGGMQSFQSQMSAYYQGYYSQSEQRANTINGVIGDLGAAGISGYSADQIGGASRDQIRAVVDYYSANKDTTEGARQYAAVIKAANALTAVTPALTEAVTAAPVAQQVGSSGGGGGSSGPSAADQVKNALQQYTDAILGEVKRIRDDMAGTDQQAYAAAQARLDLTAVQAQAGSEEAFKSLPALSQGLLALAKDNTSSLLEYRMVQAQTADTLERTANIVASKNGFTVPAPAASVPVAQPSPPELAYMPPVATYSVSAAQISGGTSGGGADLVMAVRALLIELQAINENTAESAKATDTTAMLLTLAMPDRDAIATRAAA